MMVSTPRLCPFGDGRRAPKLAKAPNMDFSRIAFRTCPT